MTVFSREKEPNMIIFFSLPRPTMKVFPDTDATMIAEFEKVLIVIQQNSSLFLFLFYLSSKRWSFAW